MARHTSQPPAPQPADLSADEIRAGIPKLQRRLEDLEAVKITFWGDDVRNELDALQKRIAGTLDGIFGLNTVERERFDVPHFTHSVTLDFGGIPQQEWMSGYSKAVAKAISTLRNALHVLNENLEDIDESFEGHALRAYEGLDLHSEIDRAAGQLYRDGHYANAIEDAVKSLNNLVRLRSGEDKDGTALMEKVFSPNNPILKFNSLADDSDRNEQKGFMMLFSGAVVGLRNPRAHKLIQDDAERALEFIAFVSLLAKLVDKAEKA